MVEGEKESGVGGKVEYLGELSPTVTKPFKNLTVAPVRGAIKMSDK